MQLVEVKPMGALLKEILDNLQQGLEHLYGKRLVKMLLFGSQARCDAEPGSDIDVLVVLQGQVAPGAEIAKSGELRAALSLKYDVVVSCTFISAERYEHELFLQCLGNHREGITA